MIRSMAAVQHRCLLLPTKLHPISRLSTASRHSLLLLAAMSEASAPPSTIFRMPSHFTATASFVWLANDDVTEFLLTIATEKRRTAKDLRPRRRRQKATGEAGWSNRAEPRQGARAMNIGFGKHSVITCELWIGKGCLDFSLACKC